LALGEVLAGGMYADRTGAVANFSWVLDPASRRWV
jgi:hypothetical protein